MTLTLAVVLTFLCGSISSKPQKLNFLPFQKFPQHSIFMSCSDTFFTVVHFTGDKVLSSVARSLQNGAINALSLSGLHLSSDPSYEQFFSSLQHSPISELSLQFSVTEDMVVCILCGMYSFLLVLLSQTHSHRNLYTVQ